MEVKELSALRPSLVVIAAVTLVGCGGDGSSPPFGQTWSSPHFAYAARTQDSTVCGGVVDRLEEHFALVNAYLGVDWPDRVIPYYKYMDEDDLDSHSTCPRDGTACTNRGVVHSALVLDGHELIHAYMDHIGRPPSMFQEGLAEALSPRGNLFPAPSQTWREVLAASATNGVPARVAYTGGAWLVSYLLRTFGPARFVSLYSALPPDADEVAVAAAFQQSYGKSLDDVWAAALSSGPLAQGVPIWECASAPVGLGSAPAQLAEQCDGSGSFATMVLDQLTVLNWQDLTLDWGLNIAGCDLARQLFVERVPSGLDVGAMALPGGTYYLASLVDTGTVGFATAPNAMTTICADAAPIDLPSTSQTLTLAIADGPAPWFVKLHPTASSEVNLKRQSDDWYVPDVTVADVELCADCTSPCQLFDETTPVADGQILRIGGLGTPAGVTVVRLTYH
jgi:hypothetical protein